MKPSGAGTSLAQSFYPLSKRNGSPITTARPTTLQQSLIREPAKPDQRHKGFRQKTLRKAVAVIRSKSKTQRLVKLCEQVTQSVRQSDAWFAKYEKFFRSPVWKLVSDEAIRKAHFKCECWGCPGRATQVYLLEFPEEHLEPNFDWMNRDSILIALCSHHHEMMHGLVMKRVVPLHRRFDSTKPGSSPCVLAVGAPVPAVAAPQ